MIDWMNLTCGVAGRTRTMKRKGGRIAAVMHYRAKTGNGLREANDVVQAL